MPQANVYRTPPRRKASPCGRVALAQTDPEPAQQRQAQLASLVASVPPSTMSCAPRGAVSATTGGVDPFDLTAGPPGLQVFLARATSIRRPAATGRSTTRGPNRRPPARTVLCRRQPGSPRSQSRSRDMSHQRAGAVRSCVSQTIKVRQQGRGSGSSTPSSTRPSYSRRAPTTAVSRPRSATTTSSICSSPSCDVTAIISWPSTGSSS